MSDSLQHHFDNLLNTEMDRREFLAYAGATLLGILGVSSLIKSLTQTRVNKEVTDGYGASTYGGRS